MNKKLAAAGLLAVVTLLSAAPAEASMLKRPFFSKESRERNEDSLKVRNALSTSSASSSTSSVKSVERKTLQGTVTAMSTGTLTVAVPKGTSWQVNVSADDKITAQNGIRVSLNQVKVGHRVIVSGVSSSSSVMEASAIKDVSLKLKKGVLHGVISNLNTALQSFTLTLKNGSSVNVNLSADAKIKLQSSSSTATSTSSSTLQNGMGVNVKGYMDKSSNIFMGSEIMEFQAKAVSSSTPLKAKLYGWLRLGL